MLSAKNVLSLVVKVVEVLIARLAIEIVLCTELHETTNSSLLQTSFSVYIQLVQFNFSRCQLHYFCRRHDKEMRGF